MTLTENRIIPTSDGSSTIYSPSFNTHYHSQNGAMEESIHIFISGGLEYCIRQGKSKIAILEIGFGTGLNALLSLIKATESQLQISYTGIEKYPVDSDLIYNLNYPGYLNRISYQDLFLKLHKEEWGKCIQLSPNFTFEKRNQDFEEINELNAFDLIYFDAFEPAVQTYYWEPEFLSKMYAALKKEGILVTYCAKGSFKRALKTVGFEIQSLNGPTGKREMTRAIKRNKKTW